MKLEERVAKAIEELKRLEAATLLPATREWVREIRENLEKEKREPEVMAKGRMVRDK